MFKKLRKAWKRFKKGLKNFTFLDFIQVAGIVIVAFINPIYAAVMAGSYLANQVTEGGIIEDYEEMIRLKELMEKESLEAIEDKEAFSPEWLAGGEYYNACFAGGALFNPKSLINPHYKIIREEQTNLDLTFLDKINFPYSYNAGNPNFYDSVTEGLNVNYPAFKA